MKKDTKMIHGGQAPDKAYNSLMAPIYYSSSFAQDELGVHSKYAYSRTANPTRTAQSI